MPELPEVEVVRRGLEPVITGATVTRVTVGEHRSLKRHAAGSEDFIHQLQGATLQSATRRGKFIWFPLSHTTTALVAHLGMSGQMLVGDYHSDFGRHLRIRLDLETAEGLEHSVGFVDQRIFGSMAIDSLVPVPDNHPAGCGSEAWEIPQSVSHIARDPLDPFFSDDAFVKALQTKQTGIKRALLDQNLLSGVGNIYADEALYATKLHYDRPASTLRPAVSRQLLANIREVFLRALRDGGTSFDAQYVNVNGQSGYFERSLQAYGRDGQACNRCGGIIVRERFMNRSSYRCRRCQKVPTT
jgi:formamidopyrimidine-DNA glycosylase